MNDEISVQGRPDGPVAAEPAIVSTALAAGASVHGNDPGLTGAISTAKGRLVTLRLAPIGNDAECHFWVGLAASGKQSPAQLMDLTEMGELFTDAATKGLKEDGPVMLSDTSVTPPRYVYLLPVPELDFRARSVWIQELVQSIAAWAPKSAGFYIAPQLVESHAAHELLAAILTALIQSSPTSEFVLLTGSYGLNAVLNVALRLKADLDGDSMTISVHH